MPFRLWARKAAIAASMDDTLYQSSRVITTAQGDELVLLDLKGEHYYTLNEVGSRAWQLLARGATRTDITDVIRREYDVRSDGDGDPVEKDIARLLDELYAAGLVTADDSNMSD